MAYDLDLADRVRERLAPLTEFEELKMFGGLAFMVNTHMACGIVKDDLMVRVGKEGHDAALAGGAKETDFTGRPMRGLVIVLGPQVADESALSPWVELAVAYARSEPLKRVSDDWACPTRLHPRSLATRVNSAKNPPSSSRHLLVDYG